MPTVEVHAESLRRRYVAPCVSLACLLNAAILVGTLVLPLYVAFVTRLWQREVVRSEQLRVSYQSRLVVHVVGMKTPAWASGNRHPFVASWTTSNAANELLAASDALRAFVVTSSAVDSNNDGLTDELHVGVRLPLEAGESVHGVYLAAYCDVAVQESTRMRMDALLTASAQSAVPASRLLLDGSVRLQQRSPLPSPLGGVYVPFLGGQLPLPDLDRLSDVAEVSPEGLLAAASRRNFSLAFDLSGGSGAGAAWLPDPVPVNSVADFNVLSLRPRAFEAELVARIPPTPVWVRPTIAEELKHGWIQYAALLAVTAPLAILLRRVLFGWRLLETAVLVDAPRTAGKLHAA